MPKPNPILAAFERKKEKEFLQRLHRNSEMNMIAMLLAGNNLGFLGEKRAGVLLDEMKADIHRRLVQILGKDEWKRVQKLFPLLYEYWEV